MSSFEIAFRLIASIGLNAIAAITILPPAIACWRRYHRFEPAYVGATRVCIIMLMTTLACVTFVLVTIAMNLSGQLYLFCAAPAFLGGVAAFNHIVDEGQKDLY